LRWEPQGGLGWRGLGPLSLEASAGDVAGGLGGPHGQASAGGGWRRPAMSSHPWVDFRAVRERVAMEAVLGLCGVDWLKRSGRGQLRGRCPIHQRGGQDAFQVSLAKSAFQCFYCQAHGNLLDFVAAMEKS